MIRSGGYLNFHFKVDVCDDCRDEEGLDRLITKTDAIAEYRLTPFMGTELAEDYPSHKKSNPKNDTWTPIHETFLSSAR